jgi:hypothetical protein
VILVQGLFVGGFLPHCTEAVKLLYCSGISEVEQYDDAS